MTIKQWALPATLLLSLSGCDGLLTETPRDFLTPANFYTTEADANSAVLSVYKSLVNNSAFQHRIWSMTDAASDVGQIGPLEPTADIRSGGILNYDAATTTVTVPWGQLYTAVGRANLAIERVPEIAMPAAPKAALVGEARFLRGLIYFYLVRLYGDVPLVVTTDPEEQLARTPRDEVYRQIIADAEEAAKTLPATRDGSNQGRATRGAALTLLADAHLTRGEWQKAADAAKQVIDSGAYALFPDYIRAFLPAFENGPEHIFSLQAEGPSLSTTSAFPAIYFPREVGRGQGGGNGSVQPTPWHYDSYAPGDYRREVSYATRWVNVVNNRVFNVTPHVYKFRPSQVTLINSGDVNLNLYRYAEVLLIHAEALNELNRTPEAVQYLNMVRARARQGTGGESRAQPANYAGAQTQAAVREAIFDERRWELAHEPKRWFDLVRRGESYFLSQIRAHDPQATDLEATDMLWPIPQAEIDLNKLLVQNPGY